MLGFSCPILRHPGVDGINDPRGAEITVLLLVAFEGETHYHARPG